MNLSRKVKKLESVFCAEDGELPDIHIISVSRRPDLPDCKPDRLSIILVRESKDRQARTFYRGEDETEETFLARVEQYKSKMTK